MGRSEAGGASLQQTFLRKHILVQLCIVPVVLPLLVRHNERFLLRPRRVCPTLATIFSFFFFAKD